MHSFISSQLFGNCLAIVWHCLFSLYIMISNNNNPFPLRTPNSKRGIASPCTPALEFYASRQGKGTPSPCTPLKGAYPPFPPPKEKPRDSPSRGSRQAGYETLVVVRPHLAQRHRWTLCRPDQLSPALCIGEPQSGQVMFLSLLLLLPLASRLRA